MPGSEIIFVGARHHLRGEPSNPEAPRRQSISSFAYRALLLTSALAGVAGAQEPYVVVAKAYEVNLIFSAADFEGRPIEDLTVADMRLLDAGKAQLRITKFEHHESLPLRVGLVVDTSGSMLGAAMRSNQAIANLFATKVLRNASDRAFVTGFDFDQKLLVDWTNDAEVLRRSTMQLGSDAGSRMGGTALYDSVYRTVRDQFAHQPGLTAATANAVLLFSDGDDNVSHAYLKDVVNLCEATQTRIYVFSREAKSRSDSGEKNLRELAARTGGQVFYDEQPETALADLRKIEGALRNSYTIAYTPSNVKEDGKFHAISLTSPTRGGVVTTRTGYYAPVPTRSPAN
jgi:VWFA-related protein